MTTYTDTCPASPALLSSLTAYIRNHGHACAVANSRLLVLDVTGSNGDFTETWIELEASWEAVRNWLGY